MDKEKYKIEINGQRPFWATAKRERGFIKAK